MRTTNYVCLLVACIATTSTVEAIAVNQLEQTPSDLAQADPANFYGWATGGWWGDHFMPDCLEQMGQTKRSAISLWLRIDKKFPNDFEHDSWKTTEKRAALYEVYKIALALRKKEKSYPRTPWKAPNDCKEAAADFATKFEGVKDRC